MKIILPVFFRQTDACLATRRGFQTMSELNPQVGRELKILATSPPLVPGGFCFRGDYTSPIKERIIAQLGRMSTTKAGQQVLTLFQSGELQVHPIACLEPAFELLRSYSKLCVETNVSSTLPAGTWPKNADRLALVPGTPTTSAPGKLAGSNEGQTK